MKKGYIALAIAALLIISAVAFARPGGMMSGRSFTAEQQQFFAETRDLRKEMQDARFELRELYRSPERDQTKIDALTAKIESLRGRIQEKAKAAGIEAGCGTCADPNPDCPNPGMQGGKGRGCGSCGPDQASNRCGKGRGMMMGRYSR